MTEPIVLVALNVQVPESLRRELRVAAVHSGVTLRQYVETALRASLHAPMPESQFLTAPIGDITS